MSTRSCIRCTHYLACKDPHKSIIHFCRSYRESRESLKQEASILEEIMETPFATALPQFGSNLALPGINDGNMFDAYEILKTVLEDKRIVSPDIKIPEGDFLEAPNFYTWCVDEKFLNQKPFVKQALIGTHLFAEYCPQCSDVEWILHDARVNDSLGKFERKVALMEHGRCPHCKKTKLYYFKKRMLNPYWELALNAGQRSGKSALFGMMASYLTHRMVKLERPNEVYGLLKANVLHGTFVALTFQQAKDTLYEPFYGHLLDSPWFCIAEDTPISLADGSKVAIQDVVIGSTIRTLEGDQAVLQVFDNGVQDCTLVTLADGHEVIGTDQHQVRCLLEDGTLIWKEISNLTEEDFVVVEDSSNV